jgi:hypothetical protein
MRMHVIFEPWTEDTMHNCEPRTYFHKPGTDDLSFCFHCLDAEEKSESKHVAVPRP